VTPRSSPGDGAPGPSLVGSSVGPYRLEKLLSSEAAASLYLAVSEVLSRQVVLEVAPKASADSSAFLRAARATAALNHSSVAPVYDVGETEDVCYVARSGASRRTLAQRLREGSTASADALSLAAQVARALGAAHGKGLAHGALSADRVLLPADGDESAAHATLAGFRRPDAKEEDRRQDLRSLGALLETMVAERTAAADDPRLNRAVRRLLSGTPGSRYEDASSAAKDLARLAQEVREEAATPSRHDAAPFYRRPIAWLLAAAALGAVLVPRLFEPTAESPELLVARPLTTFPGDERDPSFSPDGERVVFAWKGPDEADYDLYVKNVASDGLLRLTDTPLDETEPAWSPNGEWIAYGIANAAERSIRVVSPLGGPSRLVTLVDDSGGGPDTGLAWLADSSAIVFGQDGPAGPLIWKAPVDGSAPEPVTVFAEGMQADNFPEVSAAGDELAYVRLLGGYRHSVEVQPLDGSPARRVVSADMGFWGISWTRDGSEILFGQPPRIHQPPFLWRVSAEGGAPRLIEGLGVGAEPAVSSSGRLAFIRRFVESGIRRFERASDGTYRDAGTTASSSALDWEPRLSPDESRLLFVSNRSGSDEIWVVDVDGRNLERLTDVEGPAGQPSWSPDGRLIVFDLSMDGEGDLYVVPASGGAARPLVTGPGHDARPEWSIDGEWIYFGSNRGGEFEIWKTPARGGEPIQVTEGGGYSPDASPDGKWVYFLRGRLGSAVWRFSTEDESAEPFMEDVPFGEQARWTADERGLYFLGTEVNPDGESRWILRHRDARTGALRQTADLGLHKSYQVRSIDVSRDGGTLYYATVERDESDLMIVDDFR